MYDQFPFFQVEKQVAQGIAILYLNRPDKRNAMNWDFWDGLPKIVDVLEADPEVRVVVVAGKGADFSSGLDIKDFFSRNASMVQGSTGDEREQLYHTVRHMQLGFTKMAEGKKVYVAAIHGNCIGGAVDMIAACDIRVASAEAVFSIRETKVGIIADLGSLQRLPHIIGQAQTRLLAFTGRDFHAQEALQNGLISALYESPDQLMDHALRLAAEIAENAGIILRGVKHTLNYTQEHGVANGLQQVASLNAAVLDNKALREAVMAFFEKRKPNFHA